MPWGQPLRPPLPPRQAPRALEARGRPRFDVAHRLVGGQLETLKSGHASRWPPEHTRSALLSLWCRARPTAELAACCAARADGAGQVPCRCRYLLIGAGVEGIAFGAMMLRTPRP
jgi:hypothetical protein